jgi:hypothetical protein
MMQSVACKDLKETLLNLVEKAHSKGHAFKWLDPKNEHWALFNGVLGIYSCYYKSKGKIDPFAKGYVHGFNTKTEFMLFAKSLGLKFVKDVCFFITPGRLERALNEAIKFTMAAEPVTKTVASPLLSSSSSSEVDEPASMINTFEHITIPGEWSMAICSNTQNFK